ncbi:Ectonucleoside triphosphate diphosphohydrolase 7 [Mactra antiquata]
MARIYLRSPQCSSLQDMLTLRQWLILSCGVFLVIILLVAFIHSHYQSNIYLNSKPHFLPTANSISSSDQTYFSYGPNVRYGIVLDCGSSGTRVYVYIWPPHSGNPRDLLNIQQLKDQYNSPVVKKVSPGLGTFADKPEEASEYIRPLLEYAGSYIPKEQHRETLLYILATAGMRLLPEESQEAILTDLQKDIPKTFDFVISENNFEVISGKQEGVYAWIAANYALQKFGHGEEDHPLVAVDIPGENGEVTQHVRRRTVGMIDMGGGSMQIAYELTANIDSVPKHLIAEFNLGCLQNDIEHTYRVYVTTFLGYGANEARVRYEQLLVSKIKQTLSTRQRLKRSIIKPTPAKQDVLVKQLFNMSRQGDIRSQESGQESVLHVPADPPLSVAKRRINNSAESVIKRPEALPETVYPFRNIPDPCLQKGLTLPARDNYIDNEEITFMGTGDYHKCQESLHVLLNLSQPCEVAPCSMNGVHQPPISFKNSEFYGFSEFWYTMEDVYRIGGLYEHDVFEAQAKVKLIYSILMTS